jgi:hypothetical protein
MTKQNDRGAAMILVMAWSLFLVLFALVVVRAIIAQIAPSDASERSYAALAAAEAGVDDYRAHLLAQPNYYQQSDPDNASLTGWASVPGGVSNALYTVSVDASRAAVGGEVRVFSTGKSGNLTRTVEAVLTKRSTLDYVYLSDIETPSPRLPGAYSTAAGSGGATGVTAQDLAASLCSRYWYQSGSVSNSATGNQRNLNFCQWAGINVGEKITGKIHTNDMWRLQNSDLSAVLDLGAISSSCRSTADGLVAGEVGCSATRRFIATSSEGLYSNNSADAAWSSSTVFQGNSWRPGSSDNTRRNPKYESVLELPQSSATLRKDASATGCVYTGPTRIRFSTESGLGYMYVTSPDTIETATACGGTSLKADPASPATQNTVKIGLAQFSDLVIYMQNVPRPGQADDPDNAFDVNNQWALNTEPTCKLKGTKKYPYVIPKASVDSVDPGLFNSGSTNKGFPSEQADTASPWYANSCGNGDLYVQGSYKGAFTLASQSNIIITSSLSEYLSNVTTGKPSATSTSVIGLVSEKFTYLYRPFTAADSWVGDWKTSNAQDPKLNVAILAVDECFASQDPYFGARQGSIYLWGSLAQQFRCVVGANGGYNKAYSFDTRLASIHPPYMLQLSTEPWTVDRLGEITSASQGIGTTDHVVLGADESSATVRNVRVVSGPATATTVSNTARVSATGVGHIVVSYEVVFTNRVDIRQLFITVV